MRLIYCPNCEDIISMKSGQKRYCECRASWGEKNTYGGVAYPMGINNHDLLAAVMEYERLKTRTFKFEIGFLSILNQRFKHE